LAWGGGEVAEVEEAVVLEVGWGLGVGARVQDVAIAFFGVVVEVGSVCVGVI
jgi:hypothetical protein